MPTIQIPFKPFSLPGQPGTAQEGFYRSAAKISVAVAGSRGGKTRGAIYKMLRRCILQPNYPEKMRKEKAPYLIWIVAPVYSTHLRQVIIPEFLRAVPQELILKPFNQSSSSMTIAGLLGPTQIYFKHGNDPKALVAGNPNGIWADEFCQLPETTFDEMLVRLSTNDGSLILTGTPRGPGWAQARLYKRWEAIGRRDTPELSFHHWWTEHNPYHPQETLDHARRWMSQRDYERAYHATWDAFSGMVFEELVPETHFRRSSDFSFILTDGRRVGTGKFGVRLEYVGCGIDWGYGSGHAGALVVAGLSRGRWYALEESVEEHLYVRSDGDCWVKRAKALQSKWGIEEFYADTESPEGISHFRDADLDTIGADKGAGSVKAGCQTIGGLLNIDEKSGEPHLLILEDLCPTLRDEMLIYQWDPKKEQPVKKADNSVDAFRYLIHSYSRMGGFDPEINYDAGQVASRG